MCQTTKVGSAIEGQHHGKVGQVIWDKIWNTFNVIFKYVTGISLVAPGDKIWVA